MTTKYRLQRGDNGFCEYDAIMEKETDLRVYEVDAVNLLNEQNAEIALSAAASRVTRDVMKNLREEIKQLKAQLAAHQEFNDSERDAATTRRLDITSGSPAHMANEYYAFSMKNTRDKFRRAPEDK